MNNLCFNNLELYLDIFVLIQPRRIAIYCNYLMLFTFELYLGFVTFRTLIVSPVIGPFILMFHSTSMTDIFVRAGFRLNNPPLINQIHTQIYVLCTVSYWMR
jgi:hypothetical protein